MNKEKPTIFQTLMLILLIVLAVGWIFQQNEITKIMKQLDNAPKRYCHIEENTQKLIVTTSTNDGRSYPIHKYNKNNKINCEEGVKFEDFFDYSAVYNPTPEPKTCLITIEKEVCEIK